MLITRVITALCLLLLILPILFLAPVMWLAGLIAVIVLLAGWEFGRLIGLRRFWPYVYAVACLLVLIYFHDAPERRAIHYLLAAALVAWGVALVLLARGVRKATPGFTVLGAFLGVIMLPAFGHAVMVLRAEGIAVLLSAAVLVWAADIGAKTWVVPSTTATIITSNQPPIAPSQDLPGLMVGASLRLPMALPTKYAPISAAQTSTAADSSTAMPSARRTITA